MNDRALRVLEYHKITKILEDYCVSDEAKKMACDLRPSVIVSEIEELQQQTAESYEFLTKTPNFHLGRISDIKKYIKDATMGLVLDNEALLLICDTLRAMRNLRNTFENGKKNNTYDLPILFELADDLPQYPKLESEIERCIKSNDELYDNASKGLATIRRSIIDKGNQIRNRLDSMIASVSNQKYLQDAIITMRGDRFVIPVKAEYRSVIKGMIHDRSASGQTLYIEPLEIVNLNNDLKNLQMDEIKEIKRILTMLTNMVAAESFGINNGYHSCVLIDFIIAKGKTAHEMNAAPAKIGKHHRMVLKNARHPLINKDVVVPINFHIGEDFRTLLITGPNTGGKTVSLKTVGLFCLMFQSGLFIPADHGCVMSVFDKIYADIGDEQSIEQSLSTFSAHMTNIVRILSNVDSNTLTLFDELGSGTDPTEGAALAISILNYVHSKGGICVGTTHYSELKKYALVTQGFKNASVEFNVDTLSPTYRLEIGVPGKSNAFEISKKLGLSDEIIKASIDLINGGDLEFEDVLSHIEIEKNETRRLNDEALRLKLELNKRLEDLEHREAKLKKQQEKSILEAKNQARGILKRAKEESDRIIDELKELQKHGFKQHELDEKKRRLKELERENYTSVDFSDEAGGKVPKSLKLGQTVIVASINQNGNVVELPDDKGNCAVQLGIMRMNVNIKDLRIISSNSAITKKKSIYERATGSSNSKSGNSSKSVRPVSYEVDLRGLNVDEAMLELNKYFDSAILSGFTSVCVIHGVGTGALKRGLQDFIRNHPYVASSRAGEFGEGGAGVTIVTLK